MADGASQPKQQSWRLRHNRLVRAFGQLRSAAAEFPVRMPASLARSSRPAEFAYNRATARRLHVVRADGGGRVAHQRDRSPLTSRHARRHLTTLQPSRCVEPGSSGPAAGVARLAPIPVARRRRITRTRLGCYGRDPRDSGEGIEFLPVWQGELVYGDLAHRNIDACGVRCRRAAVRPCCRHALLGGSLDFGRHAKAGLPNNFGLIGMMARSPAPLA